MQKNANFRSNFRTEIFTPAPPLWSFPLVCVGCREVVPVYTHVAAAANHAIYCGSRVGIQAHHYCTQVNEDQRGEAVEGPQQ